MVRAQTEAAKAVFAGSFGGEPKAADAPYLTQHPKACPKCFKVFPRGLHLHTKHCKA
jgi:hypothetical protein